MEVSSSATSVDQAAPLKRKCITKLSGMLVEGHIMGVADPLADPPLFDCFHFRRIQDEDEHKKRDFGGKWWQHKPEPRSKTGVVSDHMESGEVGSRSALLFLEKVEVEEEEEEEEAEGGTTTLEDCDDVDIELPAAHIFLKEGQIEKAAVQQLVMRRASALGLPFQDAVLHLPALLAISPPPSSSTLRHLFIPANEEVDQYSGAETEYPSETDDITEPIAEPPSVTREYLRVLFEALNGTSLLDGLTWELNEELAKWVSPLHIKQLCNTFTALGIQFRDISSSSCKYFLDDLSEELQNQNGKLKQLLLGIPADGLMSSLQLGIGNLTRLELRFGSSLSASQLEPLLRSIFTSSLSDLGVNLNKEASMLAILHSKILEKLQVLRIRSVGCYESVNFLKPLAQGLTHSDCKVRFLDLSIHDTWDKVDIIHIFFQWLIDHSKITLAFQALRIGPLSCRKLTQVGLANYLRSPACTLVWLECYGESQEFIICDEDAEWQLANSLTENFSVCYLSLPWQTLAAKAYAASLIRRNVLYKSGQLLKEPQVKPNVAKLFLCGHGEVGKTTLCQALLTRRPSMLASSLVSCFHLPKTDRTRGMELHSLGFSKNEKLMVCDLGGQEEFHVFHHYFMHASNNDLFIVVCKHQYDLSQDVFKQQLEYWLRFIVSHRSGINGANDSPDPAMKPKVIVVVNFFDSSPELLQRMSHIAHDRTKSLLQHFSKALDFGAASDANHYPNLFGIKVTTAAQVIPVKSRLEFLLRDFLRSAWPIPKLCHDVAAEVLPSPMKRRTRPHLGISALQQGVPTLFLPYSAVLERCSVILSNGNHEQNERRVKAALMVLHNQGLLTYFPNEEDKKVDVGNTDIESSGTLVITDNDWFCNKLIGTLLGTHLQEGPRLQRCPWAWDKEDIKQLLRKQGCKEEHLEEILRYLQDLELCIPIEDRTGGKENRLHLLFPVLIKDVDVQYPQVGDSTFFGRRLRCKDSSMHLIPFGVFTRLQVQLHKLCSNDTFQLGYGWASFVKGNVGAVVTFGGDVVVDSWESKQWIDILVLCPNTGVPNTGSHTSPSSSASALAGGNSSMIAGNKLMDQIKTLIYEIFQASDFRGIPTVMLDEWVLQRQTPYSPAIKLSSIREKVKVEGLENSYQEWPGIASTPVVKLLLPKELEGLVEGQLNALARIEGEYSLSGYSAEGGEQIEDSDDSKSDMLSSSHHKAKAKGKGKEQTESENSGAGKLTGQHRELWRLISGRLDMHDHRQKQRFADISSALQIIREDIQIIREGIQILGECMRQAERNIIANCSTCLLRHELEKGSAYPVYPYLVDSEGKLRPLKALFRKRAQVHFMCESPTEGPHLVKGQKGKEVTIEVREWLRKVARVMVPAFRVMCCVARIAATVYLPSAHVFIPSPDCLVSLGIETEALQHVILPTALEALLDQVPGIDYHHLLTQEGSMLRKNEVKEAIQCILKNKKIDMATDFSLQRVHFGNAAKTFWVCDQHIGKGTPLKPIPNPFQ